uniref:Non-homologous end-joining factor 1 n=1 Tax=Arion vulgaris TaxID=1028688 RepID=A0A0B6ZEC2_9EUPU
MASELQWRRRWKPDLYSCPWRPLNQVELKDGDTSSKYFIKTKFDDSSYELILTDLTNFWYEKLADDALTKRVSKLNPSIEAPITKVLDQIRLSIEKPGQDTRITLTHSNEKVILKINCLLAGMPFHYFFQTGPANNEMGRDHMTIPLMAMVGELYRQQQELFKMLASKDKQIEDYKTQGAKVSRKYLETTVFDEVVFHNSMVTSKGFEEEVKTFGENAFMSLGQDLYREISTKRAWLLSSPVKDGDMEVSETTGSISGGPSVESWSNRLPASLAQKHTSPNKVNVSTNSSPAKSPASSKGSSTDTTPVKDTEMLRRQALERKLELEEAKQQEKVKKKKKLKF